MTDALLPKSIHMPFLPWRKRGSYNEQKGSDWIDLYGLWN